MDSVESLFNTDIFYVCFTERESSEIFGSELCRARKKFFENSKKPLRISANEVIMGFPGRLRGKIGKHSLIWKKTANKISLEETFNRKDNFVIVMRNFNNVIVSKVFFDKSQRWVKSEYFNPGNYVVAQTILTPGSDSNTIERLDYISETEEYSSVTLYPSPYRDGTAEQNIVNAKFGMPQVIIYTADGERCYVQKKEAYDRTAALNEVSSGTVILMPAWEVKDGSLAVNNFDAADDDDSIENDDISFTSLDEYASIPEDSSYSPVTNYDSAETVVVAEKVTPHFEDISSNSDEDECTDNENADEEIPDNEAECSDDENVGDKTCDIETGISETECADDKNADEDNSDTVEEDCIDIENLTNELYADEAESEEKLEDNENIADDTVCTDKTEPTDTNSFDGQAINEENCDNLNNKDSIDDETDTDEESCIDIENIIEAPNDAEIMAAARRIVDSAMIDDEFREQIYNEKPQEINVINGKIFADTDLRENEIDTYDKSSFDNKREGFGSHHFADGSLCYSGFWKDDKKHGLGISFRKADHALHVAKWRDNNPVGFISLFDPDGNLRYGGKIENGKKQGVGVSYGKDGDNVFVGKWVDNNPTGIGTIFDGDGNMLYTGMWKNGKRCGNGTEFDTMGNIIFSGEWKDDKYFNGILYKRIKTAGSIN